MLTFGKRFSIGASKKISLKKIKNDHEELINSVYSVIPDPNQIISDTDSDLLPAQNMEIQNLLPQLRPNTIKETLLVSTQIISETKHTQKKSRESNIARDLVAIDRTDESEQDDAKIPMTFLRKREDYYDPDFIEDDFNASQSKKK